MDNKKKYDCLFRRMAVTVGQPLWEEHYKRLYALVDDIDSYIEYIVKREKLYRSEAEDKVFSFLKCKVGIKHVLRLNAIRTEKE